MPISLSGSILITGSMTTSGTITAQTLVVQTITSSIVNLTGSNIFGSQLTNRQTFTGSMFVTGSGTFTSTISAIGESTLFRGVYNDPVPNTTAVLKMSSTPTTSTLSTVVGARMSGSATANFDSYAGYFSNIALSSGTGLSYGIYATASFHTFIGETRLAQGVFNDPVAGTAASVKISATPVSGYPTAVFTAGSTGAASSGQNTYAGYFTNTTTVSGGGVNYGIYATGSSHYLGGNIGIGTTTPSSILDVRTGAGTSGTILSLQNTTAANASNIVPIRFYAGNTFGGLEQIAAIWGINPNAGANNGGQLSFAVSANGTATTPTTAMSINQAGNVGIGTTSPSSILHISASSSTITGKVILQSPSSDSGILQIGSSYGEASMMFIPGVTAFGTSSPARTSSYGNAALWGVGAGTYTSDPTKFGIANVGLGNNVLTVSSSGALGIGTINPTTRLFVLGSGTYNTTTSEILTSDATIFSSEMSNDAYNSILQLVSVRQSLSTGASSNGFLGFSTIDDSNGEGIRDAGRVAIVNETAAARNSATALSFWTNTGGTKTTAAAEKLRLTSGGYLRLASSGIQFNGDTAAANALNDYEEGSWTPVLRGSTVAGTVGYANRSASYVKIGNYVFVRWGFQINSISSATGTVQITGLPFTSVSWGSYQEPSTSVSTGLLATAANAYRARMFVGGASTLLEGRVMDNADTGWPISDFGGDEWIIGELFYNIA